MPSRPSLRWILVAAAPALALAGCGNAGPGGAPEGTGSTASAEITPTPDLFTNDEAAYDYFLGKGLTNFQSAGIVGNLDQESGVDPTAVQQGGPGRGIAQWSVGGRWDTDANDNCLWYATQQGQSSTSLTLQLDFIWYELTTFSGYGLAALKATTNVTDATVAFETDFEGCGTCDQSTRISYAEGVLSAYGTADYAAQFVSQSFPLATTTLMMTEGQVIPSYIELKNTGTKSWDSNTRIGTTQPRDRVSTFADSTWVSDNRPAQVTGTVAPGATYKFTFDLAASTAGTYDEFFGVVEDGVAWFSDPGQGGPPDNDLEVKITVVAKSGSDAGADDAGKPPQDAGEHGDASEPKGDSGAMGSPLPGDDGGVAMEGTDAGDGGNGSASSGSSGGGCNVGAMPGAGSPWAVGLLVAALAVASRRRLLSS
jgi:MYXO-CTERM domain-containing protein